MREIDQSILINKLKQLNPHWESGEIDSEIASFKRRAYFELFYPDVIMADINRAIILMGPRRVGKTILLTQTIQKLIDDGYEPTKILLISLDTPLFHGLSLEEIINIYTVATNLVSLSGCVIMFDEIQYFSSWEVHLKSLVDQNKDVKFIASGSAAAALRKQSLESGAGRFSDFTLPPITFYEYINLLDLSNLIFPNGDSEYDKINIEDLNKHFIKYINFGGFPEAIFSKTIQETPEKFLRSDIIDKVLLKDLPSLFGIRNPQELNKLFITIAFQTGTEVTYEDISRKTGIAKNTIKKYLEYLEAAFLIKMVKRVTQSGRSFKRNTNFKIYLTNPSIYTALFGLIPEDENENIGNLVETAIYSQWRHNFSAIGNLYYSRWKSGEVDIVMLDRKLQLDWCVDIKWSDRYFSRPDELKNNILYFVSKNSSLSECTVTTKTIRGVKMVNDIEINFIETAFYCYILGRNIIKSQRTSNIKVLDNSEQLEIPSL